MSPPQVKRSHVVRDIPSPEMETYRRRVRDTRSPNNTKDNLGERRINISSCDSLAQQQAEKNNSSSKSQDYVQEIISYLNLKADRNFDENNNYTIRIINERLDEGYTLKDFRTVIDNKVYAWKGTKVEQYLRPSTLFSRNHFSDYLAEDETYESNESIEKFKKPTLEEVEEYCKSRNSSIDPEEFYAYYETVGWMVGVNEMKNWKTAIITWEKNKAKEKDMSINPGYKNILKPNYIYITDRQRECISIFSSFIIKDLLNETGKNKVDIKKVISLMKDCDTLDEQCDIIDKYLREKE